MQTPNTVRYNVIAGKRNNVITVVAITVPGMLSTSRKDLTNNGKKKALEGLSSAS